MFKPLKYTIPTASFQISQPQQLMASWGSGCYRVFRNLRGFLFSDLATFSVNCYKIPACTVSCGKDVLNLTTLCEGQNFLLVVYSLPLACVVEEAVSRAHSSLLLMKCLRLYLHLRYKHLRDVSSRQIGQELQDGLWWALPSHVKIQSGILQQPETILPTPSICTPTWMVCCWCCVGWLVLVLVL